MGIGKCTAAKVTITEEVLPELNLKIENKSKKNCPEFQKPSAKLDGKKFARPEGRALVNRAKFFAAQRLVDKHFTAEQFESRVQPRSNQNKENMSFNLPNGGEVEMSGVLVIDGWNAKLPPKGSGYHLVELSQNGRKVACYLSGAQFERYFAAMKGRHSKPVQVEIGKATVKREERVEKSPHAPTKEAPKAKSTLDMRLDSILAQGPVASVDEREPSMAGEGFKKREFKTIPTE